MNVQDDLTFNLLSNFEIPNTDKVVCHLFHVHHLTPIIFVSAFLTRSETLSLNLNLDYLALNFTMTPRSSF